MVITPCKDCTDRHESCHSTCDKYKEWRSELDADKVRIAKVKIQEADVVRRRNDAIAKMKKIYGHH